MISPTFSKPIVHAVKELILFIDKNPLNRESISTLFPHYYSNRNVMYPAFKSLKGLPINEYRTYKLMEAAASMLSDGELTIRQVAYKCGFRGQKAPSNFTRAFKKVWEMTPKEWQKQHGTASPDYGTLSCGIVYLYSNNN